MYIYLSTRLVYLVNTVAMFTEFDKFTVCIILFDPYTIVKT